MKIRFYRGDVAIRMFIGEDEDGVGVSISNISTQQTIWENRRTLVGFDDKEEMDWIDGEEVLKSLGKVLSAVEKGDEI